MSPSQTSPSLAPCCLPSPAASLAFRSESIGRRTVSAPLLWISLSSPSSAQSRQSVRVFLLVFFLLLFRTRVSTFLVLPLVHACVQCFLLFWPCFLCFRRTSSLSSYISCSCSCSFLCTGAYFVCEVPSLCHGPYLGITVISGIVTMVFLSAKACLYNTFDSRNGISPVAVVDGQHRLGLPFLLISSAVFALVHIMVAYKSRCQARRKLAFFLMDAESVSSSSILSLLASCICSQDKFSVNMSSSLLPCFVRDGCRMGHHQFSLLAFCICSEFFSSLWRCMCILKQQHLCVICRFLSPRSVETLTQEILGLLPLLSSSGRWTWIAVAW